MARKGNPNVVNRSLVEVAICEAKDRGSAWTQYIMAHYRATGSLAPGCDAVDFYAAYDIAKSEGVGQVTEADLTALWKTLCDAQKEAHKAKWKGVWPLRVAEAREHYDKAKALYDAAHDQPFGS